VAELLITLAQNQDAFNGALAKGGVVHYARFILFDRSQEYLQPVLGPQGPTGKGPYALGIITEFDGDFEAYTLQFINEVGFVFDLGLSFTTDGQGIIPVQNHRKEFVEYLRKHNLSAHPPNEGLFNAYPFTVKQILQKPPQTWSPPQPPPGPKKPPPSGPQKPPPSGPKGPKGPKSKY
jgi:hypothetical protein